MVVSDKVYEDQNFRWGYREEGDQLGGVDPYSASKVCIEHIIRCYRDSYGMNIAAARAGNVLGGGDWAEKRLIPDIVRAAAKGEKVQVHTPNATRPWQHVLDALSGYLHLGKHILEGKDVNGAWNFGPDGDAMTVLRILEIAKKVWPEVEWEVDNLPTHPHMTYLLRIDNTKAKELLGWRPVWTMEEAVTKTVRWYRSYYKEGVVLSMEDIKEYEHDMEVLVNG
jgi:CDP-glucose 4,6-dehydratase